MCAVLEANCQQATTSVFSVSHSNPTCTIQCVSQPTSRSKHTSTGIQSLEQFERIKKFRASLYKCFCSYPAIHKPSPSKLGLSPIQIINLDPLCRIGALQKIVRLCTCSTVQPIIDDVCVCVEYKGCSFTWLATLSYLQQPLPCALGLHGTQKVYGGSPSSGFATRADSRAVRNFVPGLGSCFQCRWKSACAT